MEAEEKLIQKGVMTLYKELGVENAVRFLQLIGVSRGDYVKEHRVKYQSTSVNELVKKIKERRAKE